MTKCQLLRKASGQAHSGVSELWEELALKTFLIQPPKPSPSVLILAQVEPIDDIRQGTFGMLGRVVRTKGERQIQTQILQHFWKTPPNPEPNMAKLGNTMSIVCLLGLSPTLFFLSRGLSLSLQTENKLNVIDFRKSLCMCQWSYEHQQDCSAQEKWLCDRLGGSSEPWAE